MASLSLTDVTITAAQTIPAGNYTAANGQTYNNLPTFCRVAATATPTSQSQINFEVWMPPSGTWNGIFRAEGSGGSAGAITFPLMANAIQRNYATMSNDNGHTGSIWTFSLQPEKVNDFGYRSQHVTTVAAKSVIRAFYRQGPSYSYFYGCSQGGHHGLMEAQRYPDDYDGIVAGDPGNDWTSLMFGELWTGVKSTTGGPATDLPQTQLDLVTNAVLAQCGSRDGGLTSDPFLSDPRDCPFNPQTLQCKPGQDPSTCLSADQVGAVQAIYQGATNAQTQRLLWPGFLRGSETYWREVLVGIATAPGGSSASFFKDGVFAGEPNFSYLNINFGSDVTLTRNKAAGSGLTWSQALDAVDPDLDPFRHHGGKLLMYHGFADPFVTPLHTLDYYTAVIGATGRWPDPVTDVRSYARLFMVPGMTIAGAAPAPTCSMVPIISVPRKTRITMSFWPCGNGSNRASHQRASSRRNTSAIIRRTASPLPGHCVPTRSWRVTAAWVTRPMPQALSASGTNPTATVESSRITARVKPWPVISRYRCSRKRDGHG